MKSSIICIGNRFIFQDCAGMEVFELLQDMQPFPDKVNLVEGGLAGLNLLPLLEQGGRVVFVDAVAGFTLPGKVVVLDHEQIMHTQVAPHFDHETGLAYLLYVLPKVCEGRLPEEIVLVGIEGKPTAEIIKQAATLTLTIATEGLKAQGLYEQRFHG